MVLGIANLAMATGNIGRPGVGVNPLRGQNNVQGSCDMGSFPHEFSGYRHISDPCRARDFRSGVGRARRSRAGPAHSQHVRRGAGRQLQGSLRAGRRRCAVRAQRPSRGGGAERDGMRRRAGFIFQRDGEICACVSAGFVVPREEWHFHQQRAANLDGAQSRGAARRQGRLGNHLRACDRARLSDEVCASVGNHGRDRAADAHFCRCQLRKDRAARLRPMAMQRWRTRPALPRCMPIDFVRGKGRFTITEYVPTEERTNQPISH